MHASPAGPDQEPPLPAGTIIGGRYVIEKVISLGGTSFVYRATDQLLGRAVALKIILRTLIGHATRFEREARAMAALEHPAVVRVYGMGVLEDDRPFLVLEHVPGETLGQRLKRDETLTPKMAAGFLAPVVGALVEAHARGICHRDVKPDNMMIQPMRGGRPTVRVLDFGIAGFNTGNAPRLTRSGQIMGTPEYMAPEQAAGELSGEPADVWACGVVLYQMLMGHPPFRGKNTPEILYHLLNTDFPPLKESIPAALREIIAQCLKKAPDDRPSAADILGRLEAFLLGVDIKPSAPRDANKLVRASAEDAPSFDPTPPEEPVRTSSGAAWALVGLLAGGAGGYFGATQLERPPPPPPVAVAAPVVADEADAGIDDLQIAEALLDGDQAKAAVSWINGKSPKKASAEWRVLGAVAHLRAGYIRKGLEQTRELLATDPEVRSNARLVPALVRILRFKRGDGAVELLAGPLSAYAKDALQAEVSDPQNQRARDRALKALEKAGQDTRSLRLAVLRTELAADKCATRRDALASLVELKDADLVPTLQKLVDTPAAKCLGDALPQAIATLGEGGG